MDIRNVGGNTGIKVPTKVEELSKEQSNIEVTNSSDTVSISQEAQALYNGGGHPDRPTKPIKP